MIWEQKNFSRTKISKIKPSSGDTFKQCNLSQTVSSEIFKDISKLIFQGCNLVNCILPSDAKTINCLHVHKSLCSHLHESRFLAGEMSECPENCQHVINTDTIEIDGIVIDIVYHYQDLLL